MRMLKEIEEAGGDSSEIVGFLPHGRAFLVLNTEKFVNVLLPKYFKHGNWNSFVRQLNLYGFRRISSSGLSSQYNSSSQDYGAYYHELFLRGHNGLCQRMRRVGKTRGQGDRRKLGHKDEAVPDFYSMKVLLLNS
jgi:hypothetical protein